MVLSQRRVAAACLAAGVMISTIGTQARGELVMNRMGGSTSIPLEKQTVRAEISGIVARVSVSQQYRAVRTRHAVEAVYRFPLPHDSAVHEFTMTVGDRIIVGEIEEREQAREEYELAKAQGKAASLLEQETPNVFTMRVANLMPTHPVEVRLVYSQRIALDEDRYRFRFPLRVGARYTGEDLDPAHARAVTEHTGFTGFEFELTAVMSPDCEVFGLESSTHQNQLKETGDGDGITVSLAPGDPKEDIDLSYHLSSESRRVVVLPYRPDIAEPGYFLLLVIPGAETASQRPPKEFLFVLDVSGSMGGRKIEQGKAALQGFLERLDPGDTFNAFLFAGSSTPFRDSPVAATPANKQSGVEWVATATSGGGTNMLRAIEMVLSPEPDPGRERVLVLISDGQVSAEDRIIKHVHENLGSGRAFTFAVGDSPNDHLMESVAQVGGGTCEYVSNREDLTEKVLKFAERSRHALLRDTRLEWEGLKVADVVPAVIPNLYAGRPLVVLGRYRRGGRGKVTLAGISHRGEHREEVEVELPDRTDRNAAVAFLWAGERIREIMRQGVLEKMQHAEVQAAVTRVALKHKLVTEWTSFVAIDNDPLSELIARATAEARRQAIRAWKAAEASRLYAERGRRTLEEARKVLKDAEKAAAESKKWSEASRQSAELSHKYAEESRRTLEKAREVLARVQRGEAVLPLPSTSRMGRVYYTALGTLSLEVYYRYLPIYKTGLPAKPAAGSGKPKATHERVRPHRQLPPPPTPVAPEIPGSQDLADVLSSMGSVSVGGGGAGCYGFRSGGGRRRSVARFGGSCRSERSCSAGSDWMSRAQEPDGHWDSRRWGAQLSADTTVTALALLSYLGAGHTEKEGQYKPVVRKGLAWLKADLADGGRMGEADHEPVIAHAAATLALTEAAGMAKVRKTVEAARRAVWELVSLRTRRSGWPREPRGKHPDFRTTVWAVMALKSAKAAGLEVPAEVFQAAASCLDTVERDREGKAVLRREVVRGLEEPNGRHYYDYEPVPRRRADFGEALPTMMGIVARQFTGWKREDLEGACRWAFGEREPRWPEARDADDGMRYFYFGTLACFQIGGEVWKTWNGISRDELIRHQARSVDSSIDGSWDPTLGPAENPSAP